MTDRPLWFWCVFPAITMSLGWGLRGSIGGGPLGAMIPGAMIGLALCLLLGRESDAGWIAAYGALGVGLGGQETYGQTVGLSLGPDTFWWAMAGFAVKGAAWGLLGGAFLGAALARISRRRILVGLLLMVAGTWIGWKFVNEPKWIYFSDPVHRPRQEVWAGLWLGGLLMLVWIRTRVVWLFALWGAVGGGVGFALGASLQPWGKALWASMPLGWWKAMELTFGALLGLAFGACAWRLRTELASPATERESSSRWYQALRLAAIAIALAVAVEELEPIRFGYTVGAAALAGLVLFSESLAWQSAITATYAAFTLDLLQHQELVRKPWTWVWLASATAVIAALVARHSAPRPTFLLLTWTAVATAFRYLLPPSAAGVPQVTMLALFALLAIAATWCSAPIRRPTA